MTEQHVLFRLGHDGAALVRSMLVSGLLLIAGSVVGCDSGGGGTSGPDASAPAGSLDDKIKESKAAGAPGGVILPGGAKGKLAPAK